ncbi:hypothetical protein [Fusobacterium ulcerans]|uniref:hypothetical protein n=1 Tax=Fusobacterium ulcerans TaxID=861 RepID=UPI0030B07F70
MEWIEYFKIAVTVGGILMGYHKFIMAHMEKKVDKSLYEMQVKFLSQQRKEDNKALYEDIKEIKVELRKMTEYLIK